MKPSLSNRSSFCLILFVILLISLTAAAFAQPPQQRQERRDPALVQGSPQTPPAAAQQPAPKEFAKLPEENVSVTNHIIMLGGKPLPYTAFAGTLLLKADLAEFIKDASGVK